MKRTQITQQQVDYCVELINSIPKSTNGFRCWKLEPRVTALIVACAIKTDSPRQSAHAIATASGHSGTALYNFLNGKDTGAAKWQELRDELAKLGVKHLVRGKEDKQATTAAEAGKTATVVERLAALTDDGPVTVVKPATLAVTNKGEVITATPPAAATTPTAMVAQGGGFATKTETTRSVIDPNTGDILVITTRRVLYGSVEHRAKMIEMNAKKA